MGKFETLGKLVAEHGGQQGLDYLRSKAEKFEVGISGLGNLKEMGSGAYLLIANHTKPEGIISGSSGLAPDAVILERIVREQAGRQLKIVSKTKQPFEHGLKEKLGFIMLDIKPGSFNRDFVKAFDAEVKNGSPILIFPQGEWTEKFDEGTNWETGAATLAAKYSLPILPAYMEGVNSWKPRTNVFLSFGKSFNPGALGKQELAGIMKKKILDLQTRS